MALNLVTFDDKKNLNNNPEIPRINKVIDDDINQLKKAINELIFPVGSIIYNASEDFDPNVSYGGTWKKIKGKMIIGYDDTDDDFNTLKATGGSKTHTQTAEEVGRHRHGIPRSGNSSSAGYKSVFGSTSTGDNINTKYFPENDEDVQPMDIMNPYYVANIWLRTA